MRVDSLIGLTEAASILGVHPSTLRAWADRGEISVSRTAGGHRRFSRAELDSWSAARRRGNLPGADVVIQNVLGRARFEVSEGRLSEENWYRRLDGSARQEHRALGRRLLTALLGFVSSGRDSVAALGAAHAIGREYQRLGRASGLSLAETVQAYQFFRENLRQSLSDALGANAGNREAIRAWRVLQGQTAQFADAVLLALITAWTGGDS